ncbi:MAG: hypothetical protein IJT27_07345 [Clostridia bacterium]|nr:hypothetical protein [Clostridia bacterium]
MKKVLAVALSVLMALMCCLPAFAEKTIDDPAAGYAAYDKAKVAQNDADYVASLNYDQIAGILLDWLDRKIAAATADFNTFEAEVFGQTVEIPLDVTGVDSLLQYKDYLPQLGGDFENLETDALDKTRADGDINFIFSIFEFVAANAETFGKVFRWDDEVFDYGKVGEFIEANFAEGTAIRDFYDDYLVGNDIQDKFIREIAREMGYTVPETRTETFDEILNNGIKAKFLEIVGDALSQDSIDAVNAMDLRTTDIYTLVKEFVGLLQNDYKDQLDDLLSGFLTALQGMVKTVLAGVNVEPPEVTIGDANGVVGTYHPGSTDFESYMPVIYSPYKEQLQGTEIYDMIEGVELPAQFAAIVAGDGTDMEEKFVLNASPVPEQLTEAGFTFPIEISFSDIETYVNTQIANQLPAIQQQVDTAVNAAVAAAQNMVTSFGMDLAIEGSVTINSVTVSLAYRGYATEDTFVTEVSATPVFDISYDGNVWTYAQFAGITKDKIQSDYIQPAVDNALTNPVATVVVTNLSGVIEELEQINTLVSYIDTEAEYDYGLLDVSANYDDYNGVVGQVNHILYGLADMIVSDDGMADLALVDGGNENLYANLQKICNKVSGLLDTMKQYIDRDTFVGLAEAADISAVFASAHGFNAGMIYDMDFSSVENALDCGIRVACDLLAEDDPDSIFYDFHMRVEDLDTLDAIAVAAVDMILGKVMNAVDFEGWDYTYVAMDYLNVAEDGAEDVIMNKAVDILYYAATFAVDKINAAANDLIGRLNTDFGLGVGTFDLKLGVEKSRSWETTLSALTDRFLHLTNGLLIASGSLDGMKGVWERLGGIVNAVLPMNTLFSNYTSLSALRSDFYDDALDGNLDALLSHFEVKEDLIAGNVPVTKALINVSDYIVDAFFPDTVEAQLEMYAPSLTVQEIFTGNESDQGIAARNMVSINGRKTHLVPCALDLIREVGLLPSLACDHTSVENVEEVASTCTEKGHAAGVVCADCGMVISGCEEFELAAHSFTVQVNTVVPTCTEEGYTVYKCAACDETENRDFVDALGHDYNEDGVCTRCGEEDPNHNKGNFFTRLFTRIREFFKKIGDFFKKLFNR